MLIVRFGDNCARWCLSDGIGAWLDTEPALSVWFASLPLPLPFSSSSLSSLPWSTFDEWDWLLRRVLLLLVLVCCCGTLVFDDSNGNTTTISWSESKPSSGSLTDCRLVLVLQRLVGGPPVRLATLRLPPVGLRGGDGDGDEPVKEYSNKKHKRIDKTNSIHYKHRNELIENSLIPSFYLHSKYLSMMKSARHHLTVLAVAVIFCILFVF